MSDIPAKVLNNAFFDKLMSDDTSMQKTAADAVNDFTRMRVREDGFARKILPPIQVSNDELDKQVQTDKPTKIFEREPGSPAAISIPFGTLPMNRYIRGDRYALTFTRIATTRFTKDVDELRTYDMDIRQVLSDNAIKDMLAEEDGKFLTGCNVAMGGSAGSTNNLTGRALWQTFQQGMSRSTLVDARKIMPSTSQHLEPTTALTNNVSIKEVEKWQRIELGGDMAEEIAVNGYGERTFNGLRWIVTIKTDLVPFATVNRNLATPTVSGLHAVYYFADPKFLGKFCVLTDTTMYIDRKAYMLEFFAYSCIGAAIGNVAGITRVDFTANHD